MYSVTRVRVSRRWGPRPRGEGDGLGGETAVYSARSLPHAHVKYVSHILRVTRYLGEGRVTRPRHLAHAVTALPVDRMNWVQSVTIVDPFDSVCAERVNLLARDKPGSKTRS